MEHTPDAYLASFRDADTALRALAGPLTPAEFNWKPAPDAWSIAQCIDHLNVIAARYLDRLEPLATRTEPRGEPPFHYDWRGRLYVDATKPKPKRTMKTFGAMEPARSTLDKQAVLEQFHSHTARFLAVTEQARGLDLSRIRLASPFLPALPFLTFPMGAILEALAGHQERHLDQARRVATHPGFPKA